MIAGLPESVLVTMGGFVSEISDPNVPAGSALIATDCDYSVSSVRTRDGLQNVYSYEGFFQERVAGVGANVAIAGETLDPWTNPDNIITNTPGTYASVELNAQVFTPSGVTIHNIGAHVAGGLATSATTNCTSAGIAVGDVIFALVNIYQFGANPTPSITSVVDNLGVGNNWIAVGSPQSFTNDHTPGTTSIFQVYYAISKSVVPNLTAFTVTANYSSTCGTTGLDVTTFHNLVALDQVAQQTYTSSSSFTIGPITTAQPECIISFVAQFSAIGGSTVPSGWTGYIGQQSGGGSQLAVFNGSNNVGPATTYDPSWTISFGSPNNAATIMSWTVAPTGSSVTPSASELLEASAFNFSIPLTSQIVGVEVQVNGKQFLLTGGGGGSGSLDATVATGNGGISAAISVGIPAPSAGTDLVLLFTVGVDSGDSYLGGTTPAGWTLVYNPVPANVHVYSIQNTGGLTFTSSNTFYGWAAAGALFSTLDGVGAIVQGVGIGGTSGPGTANLTAVTAGDLIVLNLTGATTGGAGSPVSYSVPTDSQGNVYTQIARHDTFSTTFSQYLSSTIWTATAQASGNITVSYDVFGTVASFGGWLGELSGVGKPAVGGTIEITPLTQPNSFTPRNATLPIADGSVIFGAPNDPWGQYWTPAQVNSPSFGFAIQAIAPDNATLTEVFISGVEVTVWYTPPGLTQFDYVKTFAMEDGETLTLALDNEGTFWQEDVFNNPDVLVPFFTSIEPNTFAVSTTLDDHEYIALSDLSAGTDMPRQYNGQWVDRVSQVGPAVGPQVTANANGYPIVNITQAAAETLGDGTKNYTVTWTANYGSIGPAGNILSFEAKPGFFADILAAGVGASIIISNVQTINGQNPNSGAGSNPAVYTIIAVGTVNTAFWGANTPFFSVLATSTNHADLIVQNGATYQLTLATLTSSVTVPNLQVGGQMTVSGNTQAGYNKTWTVTGTPNASQMSITSTSLSSTVATYDFTLITGTAPVPGEQVTVTNTTNGNGIFNVVNAVITSATASSFSVQINSPDIPSAPEVGNAIVNGTVFQFDPMAAIGTGTGGTIEIAGGLGAGTRGVVVLFKTRNNAITPASPQTIFVLNATASALTVTGLPTGPPDVVARIIAFTGANGATQTGGGGFYYWIEEPTTLIVNGQSTTYSATIVNDNTTTQVTLNFTDAQLLASTGISVDGNNLFATIELGSCLGFVPYASRLIAWGENNKIQNLLNPTFDGGIGQSTGVTVTTYPLGWTVDPTNGAGGSIIASPQFGDAYYIKNASGSTQALYGMITQPAYHDAFGGAPIIFSATEYSCRVTASIPSGLTVGNLVVDLYSPSSQTIWGSFTIPFASMSTSMQIFTGTLLTVPFGIVPSDLLIRLYASAIGNLGDVEVDRIEPFPTNLPVLTTQLRASYEDNFEAFDQITGNIGAAQNQQPVRNAFVLFDNLYIVKTGSMFVTTDNGTTEPNFWNVKSVSTKCGTPSIHGIDLGEGWAIIVGRPGVYIFVGGEPVKISPELDGVGTAASGSPTPGLWQSINWKYGQTIWVRNDAEQRKLFIGVPIATPNKWMPNFPANANPTKPNVVLMMNYKELMTAGEIQGEGPVRLAYTGELKSYSFGRKWSAWSTQACYADFIDRNDSTSPLFLCGDFGSGKIYQQIPGTFNDDGNAEICQYVAYGFPKSSEAQQSGMGLHDLVAEHMALTIVGNGNLDMVVYPNSLNSPDAEAQYPEALSNPSVCGDLEIPINVAGNRFFPGFSVDQIGEWFELSKIVMTIAPDPWAPTRGSNN